MGGDTPERRLSCHVRVLSAWAWRPSEVERPRGRWFPCGRRPGQQPQWGLLQAHVGGRARLVNAAKPQIPGDPGSRAPHQPHEVTRMSSERIQRSLGTEGPLSRGGSLSECSELFRSQADPCGQKGAGGGRPQGTPRDSHPQSFLLRLRAVGGRSGDWKGRTPTQASGLGEEATSAERVLARKCEVS